MNTTLQILSKREVFHPFEVNVPHLVYTLLGGFIVFFGLFSLFIKEKLYLGEAPIATAFGIIIGPHALNLFNPYSWGGGHEHTTDEVTLQLTRVVIAVGVFAVGVELPKAYMKRHWRSLFFLLGPAMLWGWGISALVIWGFVPGLRFLSALVIASCVTPTDPILAQSVVGGKFADKHVPAHIRHLLSAESGSNDGAAFPFLYIALFLTLDASPGHAVGHWFYYTIAYQIFLGTIIGALIGFLVRKIMKFSERKKLIDRQSFVAQYISLAMFVTGGTVLLGSDDLLSAFACGCAFAWDGFFNQATEDAVFSNVIDLLFNVAAFVYIGALIPFGDFNNYAIHLSVWRLVVITILILLFRRLPAILMLYRWIPDIKTFREACFTGWFGPMGVGAIFISTLARESMPEGEGDTAQVDLLRETIGPIVSFLVLASVITHGLSIPFFSLGRRVHSITYTWSRNISMDSRRDDEPAWTTHAKRIIPGQQIVVNRDDDAEDGDMGLKRNHDKKSEVREKGSPGSSSSEDSSETRAGSSTRREDIEMSEKRPRSDDEERRDEDEGGARGERAGADEGDSDQDDGRRTPKQAEYREGNDLVIERRKSAGDEVTVEVVKNHFAEDAPTERHHFTHPHSLKHGELRKIFAHLPKSVEHAVGHVDKDPVDPLGMGLMRKGSDGNPRAVGDVREKEKRGRHRSRSASRSRSRSRSQSRHRVRSRSPPASPRSLSPRNGEDEQSSAWVTRQGSSTQKSRRGSPSPPGSRVSTQDFAATTTERVEDDAPESRSHNDMPPIRSRLPAIRVNSEKPKKSLRKRLFGRRSPSPDLADAEEGRMDHDTDYLTPIHIGRSRSNRDAGPLQSSLSRSADDNNDRELSRTLSMNRTSTIRFTDDVAESSDTAPRPNYGNGNEGFRRNPGLSMYRTTSIQSQNSARDREPSVSFRGV